MSATIQKLKTAIENAGAILVGAGSGFSTAAGYTYSGERFEKYFILDYNIIMHLMPKKNIL